MSSYSTNDLRYNEKYVSNIYKSIDFILKYRKGYMFSDILQMDMKRFYQIIENISEELKEKNELQSKIIEKRSDLFSFIIEL